MKMIPTLSVIFPCYNEEGNVAQLLDEALRTIPRFAQHYELLVINDGSVDRTGDIAHGYEKSNPEVRVIDKPNGGYGSAVQEGIRQSRYEWILLVDGDLQFKLEELEMFVPHIDDADMIIGIRKKRAEGIKRRTTQELHRIWCILFLGLPATIKDVNCAFKLMRKTTLEQLPPRISQGAMVCAELLVLASRAGARFAQVPVTHLLRNYGAPTGLRPRVVIGAVRETVRLWVRLRRHRTETYAE
jgi:hypothetical protein